jgi:diadenylate cyclase
MFPLPPVFDQIDLTTIVDIGITALLIYWLFKLIRGTRAVRLVIGVSVLVLFYGLAVALDLRLLTQILQAGAVVGVFALVVIFQPELRRALERIGRVGSFGWLLSPAETRTVSHVATEVARAAAELSATGIGALIVLERETGLLDEIEGGTPLDAEVSKDLLVSLFQPYSPLHDGAVVIQGNRAAAAACFLPLTVNPELSRTLGSRHRAAIGVTEDTDALTVVVSEETGTISLVAGGQIQRGLDGRSLKQALLDALDIDASDAEERQAIAQPAAVKEK